MIARCTNWWSRVDVTYFRNLQCLACFNNFPTQSPLTNQQKEHIYIIIKLYTKPLCLWAIVWSSNPHFIPNLSVPLIERNGGTSWKWNQISVEKICRRILFWKGFDLMKYMSISERADNANPKLGVKLLWGPVWVMILIWSPILLLCTVFHLRFLFSSLVLAKPVPCSPSFGVR
jgi:hypothetical protein